MKHPTCDQRPLFDPWIAWRELPEATRQHALDVLTSLYFETVESLYSETETDDSFAPETVPSET
jgi:hypothetical protein